MAESKQKKSSINANGTEISVLSKGNEDDFISLTDIAKFKNPEFPADLVKNWMRSRSTIEFLGLWEQMYNSNFKLVEFDQFKNEAGANSFVLSPQKWITHTQAIGLVSKSGRYGGTFAHKDIAFEFASWVSAEFKLYIIKDYQRLKAEENNSHALNWNVNRILSKINYKIHTDAIKLTLIPENVSKAHQGITYATEADLLNVALFGKTAKEWRKENPNLEGNHRDYATLHQLIVLSNIESLNAEYIKEGLSQQERLIKLNRIAIGQLHSLLDNLSVKKLESLN
ncbi:KilA-N domain-containing protein [Paenibacillus psychroresistens]|uniref:KilA-N domain-containing protein n=1 Tax=Paenibacillus psychroresistens TaxID=1778678 RepID=A0A6B8RWX7_9BACL|nr:KilA-N domain-containing protein [Paenibacillus psychroresistens]QGQ99676.1 KilA-N domain-containing protein [Paenibacillus psychroresistens]